MAILPFKHVYVHVPFCGRRCSYCDFAIAVRRQVPVDEFVAALLQELERRLPSGGLPGRLGRGQEPANTADRGLCSIYLGGGTPSKLGGPGIERLVSGIAQRLGVQKFSTSREDFELTIEVNPEDVTPEAAASWVAAGVNRASVGVQSFDPEVLKWMHREHSPERSEFAIETLRAAGIGEISVDLIFALPDHLQRDWDADLERVLALEPDHLSLYGLTVEPRTPLGKWMARGEVAEAPEERYEAEFLRADERLVAAGFEHYEVSNYGRPGKRARHNSSYWSGAAYLGLGPAAHGFDGVERRWNRSAYADWLASVGRGEDPVEGRETIGPAEQVAEEVYLGLRTSDGLLIRPSERADVERWAAEGWGRLEGTKDRLRLTPMGWLRLDAIAAALTSLRSPS